MAFSRRVPLFCCSMLLLTANLALQRLNAQDRQAADRDIDSRLAKWKNVDMPFRSSGLTERERQMVAKLVEACRLLDDVYWRQSDPGGLALYKTTSNPSLKR